MSDIEWDALPKRVEWDTVYRISHDGSISEPVDRHAMSIYWDSETNLTTLENPDTNGVYTVRQFHPSEFLTGANYRHHLSMFTDANERVEFWLTPVIDLDDSESVGWALVIRDCSHD